MTAHTFGNLSLYLWIILYTFVTFLRHIALHMRWYYHHITYIFMYIYNVNTKYNTRQNCNKYRFYLSAYIEINTVK